MAAKRLRADLRLLALERACTQRGSLPSINMTELVRKRWARAAPLARFHAPSRLPLHLDSMATLIARNGALSGSKPANMAAAG